MSRDIQFAGFAKALWDEMPDVLQMNTYDDWSDACEKIIAQRAYDLVKHACEEVDSIESDVRYQGDYLLSHIPDLTELPEVSA